MNNLGFGMMRLPVINQDPTAFDYKQLEQMVDAFLHAGFTYFDTSAVYHNGESQTALRRALVERHPRGSYTVATKFPSFFQPAEDKVDEIFAEQLKALGVDYADYYLLHNITTVLYDGVDGKGGSVKKTHLFEHLSKWKEEGKVRHIGFSFHSDAQLLARILKEHPEVEFVQIAFNGIDYDSQFVQAKACYDVICSYGKKVVIMEPVKGGGLAVLPKKAEEKLRQLRPDDSDASWSIRFCQSQPNVIAVLSGMSTLDQVKDNIETSLKAEPFTAEEEKAYFEAMDIYRDSAPIDRAGIEKYSGMMWKKIPVTAMMQAYAVCQIQPDQGFADDNNYFRNRIADAVHEELEEAVKSPMFLDDGRSIPKETQEAIAWLAAHSF